VIQGLFRPPGAYTLPFMSFVKASRDPERWILDGVIHHRVARGPKMRLTGVAFPAVRRER